MTSTHASRQRRAFVLGLIASTGLAIIGFADYRFRIDARHADRAALQVALTHASGQLEKDLHYGIAAVESLAGFMQSSWPTPTLERFDEFAEILRGRYKSIRGLALIDRHSVIRHFYPLKGNESAIGLDLKRRPAAPYVATAIQEKRTTINQPTQTVQGYLAVIVRTPFFHQGRLSGLVQGVFDVSQVVADATVGLDPRIGYTLRDSTGKTFYGTGEVLVSPHNAIVRFGDNFWELNVGWLGASPGPATTLLGMLWIGGLLLLGNLLLLVWRTQVREQWLSSAVDKQTKALRDSETRYRNIVETAQEGIWQIDAANRTNFVNQKMADMLGYTVEEMLERPLFDFMDDEGRAITASNVERRKSGIAEQHEFKFLRKDGSAIWALLNTSPLFDAGGAYNGALAMVSDITERKQSEETLRASEAKYRQLFENMTSGFALHEIICDAHGKPVDYRYLQANPAFERLTGVPIATLVGKRIREILPNTEDYWIDVFGRVALSGEAMAYENYSREIGKYFDTWVFSPQKNQFAVIFTDITERKRAENEKLKLTSALEQTADSVMITDLAGIIEYVNLGFESTTGYTRAEAIGRTPSLLKSGKQGRGFYKKLWDTILAGETFSDVFINRRKDGSLYYEEKTISPLKDAGGQATHFVATGKDVTERMRAQEQLQHMAQHDALTELPNRVLLMDRLKQALARARWHDRLVAVLFVDMDRFKVINDTLGHEAGDKLLQALAARFSACVREGDTVARFGGDEFVLLLDDVSSEKDISVVAQKVIDLLAPSFEIDGQTLYITASIGVSLFPNDGEDSTTLVKNADIAMYRAKDMGKNNFQFYSADMSARAFERLTLESSLRHAIERNEFRLYYQPQIDTASGAIFGVEALLRWQHPDFGLVAPAEFIPLLEETGLIVPVGDWVFRTACEQLRDWHAAGWPRLRMAINLSPRQIQSAGLLITVKQGLATVGGDPDQIELEITENMLLRHATVTLDALDALRTLGLRLSIDDFGTGYSSLSYLRRYSIDTLKIDRSFVHDIPGDTDDSAITTGIIVLAQGLKLEVIAEGVENEAQRDFLREHGCLRMQGYLFSRPVPAAEIPALLAARNR